MQLSVNKQHLLQPECHVLSWYHCTLYLAASGMLSLSFLLTFPIQGTPHLLCKVSLSVCLSSELPKLVQFCVAPVMSCKLTRACQSTV